MTVHDMLGAYAVDALDRDERDQFEEHLRLCPTCAEELTGFREVLAAISESHAVAPPAHLADRVLLAATRPGEPGPGGAAPGITAPAPGAVGPGTTVGAAGASPPPLPLGPPGGPGKGPGPAAGAAQDPVVVPMARRRPLLTWLGAVAAGAALFASGVLLGRTSAPAGQVAAPGEGMDALLAVAAAQDAAYLPVDLMGSTTRVVVSDEMGKVALLASDLPTPAKGMCYQVWRVAEDGSKESAGVFTPDADGHVAVVLDAASGAESFVITVEPPGGSPKPTGDMVGQVEA